MQNVTAEDLEKHKKEGYTATSIIGKSGLESIYESKLRAVSGCKIIIVDENGDLKDTVAEQKARNGQDIRTTIDIEAQRSAYNQLKKDAGSAVIINSHTGEVLAMVSTPAYDPNDFAMGMDSKTWDSLNSNKQKPLLNRFVSTYCPGSTFWRLPEPSLWMPRRSQRKPPLKNRQMAEGIPAGKELCNDDAVLCRAKQSEKRLYLFR